MQFIKLVLVICSLTFRLQTVVKDNYLKLFVFHYYAGKYCWVASLQTYAQMDIFFLLHYLSIKFLFAVFHNIAVFMLEHFRSA